MSSTTQSAPKAPAIHQSVIRMGQQRGAPRVFLRGRYLERAGFTHGVFVDLHPDSGMLVIERRESMTGKRVQEKAGYPLIDLNCRLLADVFGEHATLHLRVEEGRIVLSKHPLSDIAEKRPRDGTHIELYAGIGGFGFAAKDAGFRTVAAVEVSPRNCEWFKANHPDTLVYEMSVHEAAFLKDFPTAELMTIGQPCPPWSRVRTTVDSKGTKRDKERPATDHPLGDLALWTFLLILKARPRTIILENVPGFATSETAFSLLRALEQRLGYRVEIRVLDAADAGANMRRRRTVFVAQTPEADGSVPDPWPTPKASPLRIRDLLDTNVPEDAWWDATTKPNRFRRQDEAEAKGRGFKMQVVHVDDTIAGTFTAEYGNAKVDVPVLEDPTHPGRYRYFTVSEGLRFFGMPEDTKLPEGVTYPWELIGQAIYVPLWTEIIARATGRVPNAPRIVDESRAARPTPPPFGDLPLFAEN